MDSTKPQQKQHASGNKKQKPQKRKEPDTDFEYDGKNRCLICKVDMGDCNPRQYCRKTYCENA
jgi:hypothetical protein